MKQIPQYRIVPIDECTENEKALCKFAGSLCDMSVLLGTSNEDWRDWSDGVRYIILRREYVQVAAQSMSKYNLLEVFRFLHPILAHHVAHKPGEDESAHDDIDFLKRRVKSGEAILSAFMDKYKPYTARVLQGRSRAEDIISGKYMKTAEMSKELADGFSAAMKSAVERSSVETQTTESDLMMLTVTVSNPTNREKRRVQEVFRVWEKTHPDLIKSSNAVLV